MMKIIFMGTPDFSVGTLEALVKAGHEVVLAVTQPDLHMISRSISRRKSGNRNVSKN